MLLESRSIDIFHRWSQVVNLLQRHRATTPGEYSEQSSETGRRFLRSDDADTTCHLFRDSLHAGQHYYDVRGKLHRGNLRDQTRRSAHRGVSGQNLLRAKKHSVKVYTSHGLSSDVHRVVGLRTENTEHITTNTHRVVSSLSLYEFSSSVLRISRDLTIRNHLGTEFLRRLLQQEV